MKDCRKALDRIYLKACNSKGITLIALVITIVVLVILAGVTINLLFGENGVIERSKEAKFKTNFRQIEEQISLYMADKEAQAILENITKTTQEKLPLGEKVSSTEKSKFSEHLQNEVKQVSGKEDLNTVDLYYIDKTKISTSQKHKYLIDVETLQIYDFEGEKFFNKWHHTLNGIESDEDDQDSIPKPVIDDDEPTITQEGDIGWYAPNMKGFNSTYTYLVYYNKLDNNDTKEIPVQEYISNGKKNKIEENGKTYVLDLYNEKMWANVKTNANGLECWWVWIPRYAYKIDSTNQKMKVVFVDLQNKPIGEKDAIGYKTNDPDFDINTFSTDYIIHPAFTITQDDGNKKELKGMWISKYEASNNTTHEMSTDVCYAPDMSGFDKEYTYIELYDEITANFNEEKLLGQTDLNTINNNNKWYDYGKKQWANVKTNANGLECWWVWIPRYAYCISSGNQETEVIFIDVNNKPMDKQKYGGKLPDNFIVHPAFTPSGEDGNKNLKGIWVSKYEASNNTTHEMSTDVCYAPDMSGFDKQYTYIELYDTATSTFSEEKCLADTDLNTVNSNNKWYDYGKKQWANIKTNANGLECWWVWIPRYAYYVSSGNQETEIIFIDLDNKPMDKTRYGDTLPDRFIVHPSFTPNGEDGSKNLKGIWVSKYEASNVEDVIPGTTPTGSTSLPQASDTAGKNHVHVPNGAGTKERFVTNSTKWCSGYDGTPCSNYGYYIYCSECGVRMRHYWCKNHYNPATKVIINDDNVE